MAYDVLFIRKLPDQSWDEALESDMPPSDLFRADGKVDLARVEQYVDGNRKGIELDMRRHIQSRLCEVLPGLTPIVEQVAGFAPLQMVDGETGIEVELSSQTDAAISISWHSNSATARRAAELIHPLAAVIESETSLSAYDPQHELPLDQTSPDAIAAMLIGDSG